MSEEILVEHRVMRLAMLASFLLLISSSFFLGGTIEMYLRMGNLSHYSLLIIAIMTLTVSGEFFGLGGLIRFYKQELFERVKLFNELPKVEVYNSRFKYKWWCSACARYVDPSRDEFKNGFHVECGKRPRKVPRYLDRSTRAKLHRALNYELEFKDFMKREVNLNKDIAPWKWARRRRA
jgi:hypothetical protein